MFPYDDDLHRTDAVRSIPLAVTLGLLGMQAVVGFGSVIVLFFGPWIVGPQDFDRRPDRSGSSFCVATVTAIVCLAAAILGVALRHRLRLSTWWVPVLGIVVTIAGGTAALAYLAS